LAPSPHIRTVYPINCNRSTTSFFSSGDMRAKIWHRESICVCRVSSETQAGICRKSIRVAKSPAVHY
jgi:hypothetical protein